MRIRPAEQLNLGRGTSHEFMFERFSAAFPQLAIMSQDIAAEPTFTWLRHQRERIQYLEPGFADPSAYELFESWEGKNQRALLDFYLSVDESSTDYADLFDPQHAMIAIPVRLLSDTIYNVRLSHQFSFPPDQLAHCQKLCRAGGHPISRFNQLIR